MVESEFVVEVHHGGYFLESPKKYISRKLDLIKNVDQDLMSLFEISDLVKELGCDLKNATIYHRMPDYDLDGGLREIKSDRDVVDMFAIHTEKRIIPIYVEDIGVSFWMQMN